MLQYPCKLMVMSKAKVSHQTHHPLFIGFDVDKALGELQDWGGTIGTTHSTNASIVLCHTRFQKLFAHKAKIAWTELRNSRALTTVATREAYICADPYANELPQLSTFPDVILNSEVSIVFIFHLNETHFAETGSNTHSLMRLKEANYPIILLLTEPRLLSKWPRWLDHHDCHNSFLCLSGQSTTICKICFRVKIQTVSTH